MTCERYWREGVVLAEHGEPDPHRATCEDCRRAHEARGELVGALPLVAANASGDPQWQARVWRQIARESTAPVASGVRRLWWSLSGALVTACAALIVWQVTHQTEAPLAVAIATPANALAPARVDRDLPRFEIISGPVVKRSTSARVGDRVRISAQLSDDIRVYRAERLVLRCVATAPSSDCTASELGVVAEAAFAVADDYQLVVIKSTAVAPLGSFSSDLGAVVAAGGAYELKELSIR
jgi:hypothetical protein